MDDLDECPDGCKTCCIWTFWVFLMVIGTIMIGLGSPSYISRYWNKTICVTLDYHGKYVESAKLYATSLGVRFLSDSTFTENTCFANSMNTSLTICRQKYPKDHQFTCFYNILGKELINFNAPQIHLITVLIIGIIILAIGAVGLLATLYLQCAKKDYQEI